MKKRTIRKNPFLVFLRNGDRVSEDKIIEIGKRVVNNEGNAVLRLEHSINNQFARAVREIYNIKGRVVLTGVGKSGLIARKIVATLNSTGTPSIFMHPTDALHGDLGMVRKEDIIILLSKSGNTEELINMIPMIQRLGVLMIGMIGNENSKMGETCDIILDVSVAEEACPYDLAPTSSTTATLAMGDALAVALLELRGFTPEDFAMLHPGGSLGKRLSLKISEIMYKGNDIPKVAPEAPLKDCIIEMASKRLGITSVVDNDGKLVGVITDGDLRRLLEKTLEIKELTAEHVMGKNPKTIKDEYLASFAITEMEKYNITALIVENEQKNVVGIVHLHDLVKIGLQRR